jgi:hypothetical protein
MDRLKHESSMNKQFMLESLKLLHLIIDNIIKNPCEEKYRRIKLTNKKLVEHVSRYPCCEELMEFVGF